MNHFFKRATAVALATVMSASLCISGLAVAGEDEFDEESIQMYANSDCELITYEVNYNQSKARETLDLANEFRQNPDNLWYWNSSNTDKISVDTLPMLSYDYALEELAMQRAAELTVYYSHTRPNGESNSAKSDFGYTGTIGENILYGVSTSFPDLNTIMSTFEEDNENYSGQGHRRILLNVNNNYTNYAMSCVYNNNNYYWVMLLATDNTSTNTTEPTTAVNGKQMVSVSVSPSAMSGNITVNDVSLDTSGCDNWSGSTPIYTIDGEYTLPTASMTFTNSKGDTFTTTALATWTSADSSKLVIDNDTYTATFASGVSVGSSVQATASVFDKTFTVIFERAPHEHSNNIEHVLAVAPTCTTDGNIEYWYDKDYDEYFADETLTQEITYAETIIPATGHRVGDPNEMIWNWSSDHNSATVSYVCMNCRETITVDATVTSVTTDCTCTTDGTRIYTATAVINGVTYTEIYEETVPALGHELSATFNWYEEDGTVKCDAHITCSRGDVDENVSCNVYVKSSTSADCTHDGETTYGASIGFGGETFYADDYTVVTEKALGHDYGAPSEWNWSADHSTCRATFVCSHCGDSYTVDCEVTVNYTAPECETDGQYAYTAKAETYTNTEFESIPALGHEWNDGVVTTEPTCVTDGVRTYTCTRCGATRTESIPATGEHTWNDGVVTKQATCEEPGVMTYTCIVCGATYTVEIPATGGHVWNSGVVTKEPTCTEEGVMTYTCTVCGATETVALDALGHNYTTSTVAPTCTEQGYTEHTCTRCGLTYDDDFVAALGHDYQSQFNWSSDHKTCTITITCSRCDYYLTDDCVVTAVITKTAKCEELGETTYTATYNGLSSIVTIADIPALDHTYQAEHYIWIDSEGRTWEYNGEQDPDFIWDENVKCQATLVCTVCGKEYVYDCEITTDSYVDSNGRYVTEYTASVGDSGLFFSVTRNGDSVVGIKSTEGTVEGAEIGDTSAEEANEGLGEIVSSSIVGELDMPDAEPSDTTGGQIQTSDVIAIIGTAVLATAGVALVATRKTKDEEKG